MSKARLICRVCQQTTVRSWKYEQQTYGPCLKCGGPLLELITDGNVKLPVQSGDPVREGKGGPARLRFWLTC